MFTVDITEVSMTVEGEEVHPVARVPSMIETAVPVQMPLCWSVVIYYDDADPRPVGLFSDVQDVLLYICIVDSLAVPGSFRISFETSFKQAAVAWIESDVDVAKLVQNQSQLVREFLKQTWVGK